ncbi:MAG: hypothetical protein KAU50_05260 [Candidatus Marinimicrobia bacterium]|nr:hypothetical protein [Candidatus Neomarinimicrobiota bacterium]
MSKTEHFIYSVSRIVATAMVGFGVGWWIAPPAGLTAAGIVMLVVITYDLKLLRNG